MIKPCVPRITAIRGTWSGGKVGQNLRTSGAPVRICSASTQTYSSTIRAKLSHARRGRIPPAPEELMGAPGLETDYWALFGLPSHVSKFCNQLELSLVIS